jgi:RpiB/LacA/LacB family sugar-phosphate isomerase
MRRIILASDHVGFYLKQFLIQYLKEKGFDVIDAGTDSPNVVVDYPDYAQKAAFAVVQGQYESGIVICGTGIGVSIAANKVAGARAALCLDVYMAHQARAHNDANILALGAWIITPQRAVGIVDEWLTTPFEGGRHIPRVKKLNSLLPSSFEISPLHRNDFHFGISLSPRKTVFGPVLFAGRLWEGINAVAEAGLDHIELSLCNVDDVDFQGLQKTLKVTGLKISAIATGQVCLEEGLCLAAKDPEKRQAAVARMKKLIELASRLESGIIIGGVRGKIDSSKNDRFKQEAQVLEAIIACVHYAKLLGVPVYLEPINRYETNFINNVSEALSVLNKINETGIFLLLDTFHMNIEEYDLPAALLAASNRLGYLHISESNRLAPGQGHLDFITLLQTAKNMGFQGPITAEILPLPDDESALQAVVQFLNSLFKK